MQTNSAKNTIVLLGIGHTNAHILKSWKMNPIDDCQLICVSNFPVSTYSGMLPGVLAGQYPIPKMEIDLVRLCASANVRLIIGNVTGIDRQTNRIQFADRPDLSFDLLSIGVGSQPSFKGIDIRSADSLVSIKPMQTFNQRLKDRLRNVQLLSEGSSRPATTAETEAKTDTDTDTEKTTAIAVVGGGIGSIEIAFCLDRFLQSNTEHDYQIRLVAGKSGVGSGLLPSTKARVLRCLKERGIAVVEGQRVKSIETSRLILNDQTAIPADVVLWATNAVAPELLERFDFPKDGAGFLMTQSTLQIKSTQNVFAVGDTGTIEGAGLDKAGVFAVRQGPVLWENLKRSIKGQSLEVYRPQRDYLKLINTADGRSIAEFKGRSFYGRWCWWLKDRIDVKFMAMYQNYEPMAMKASTVGTGASNDSSGDAMRCLGCGGKIGSQVLSSVLSELEIVDNSSVVIGLKNPDDAAVIRTRENQVTVTTDFFASPLNDPYLTGRIATLNSASDCFVMGAQPTAALALIQLPLQHAKAQLQTMRELMAGSVEELNGMGASIVGGHSIEGPRLTAGFTVLGDQLSDAKTKGMLAVGDNLVLTKPLGSGVLLAALMQAKLSGHDYEALVDSMLRSNAVALDLIRDHAVSAITDVTGFGLAGHLKEMLVASGVSAEIRLKDVRTLSGVEDLVEQGIESTLAPDNRINVADFFEAKENLNSPEVAKLFDPQTGGGILLGIAEQRTAGLLNFLYEQGFEESAVVGKVITQHSDQSQMVIKR